MGMWTLFARAPSLGNGYGVAAAPFTVSLSDGVGGRRRGQEMQLFIVFPDVAFCDRREKQTPLFIIEFQIFFCFLIIVIL